MHVVGRPKLEKFWKSRPDAAALIETWLAEAQEAQWKLPSDIKKKYCHASILKDNRVVFNIGGNKFRLVVKINYGLGVIRVHFIGTHEEYDRINAEEI